MSSAIVEYLDKLDNQWKEIDRLAALAIDNEKNSDLYNSLCRAAIVLCVSHLESFYKDAVKYYLSDMNSIKFKDLPVAMKRVFCQGFVGHENTKESNEKVQRLMKEFESHDTFPLSEEYFLPEKNKNPKPSVLESICSSLGAKDLFSKIDRTMFDSVFSMNEKQIERSVEILNKKVKKKMLNFPCKVDSYLFKKIENEIESEPRNKKNQKRTLWEEFIDNLNIQRHEIAHGNNLDNNSSPKWIITAKNKCRILQLVCILLIATNAYSEPEPII